MLRKMLAGIFCALMLVTVGLACAEEGTQTTYVTTSAKTVSLATPQITSVKANGTSVTVTWGKVAGAEKYRLFYKKDGKWKALKDTTGTSATITGGTLGKTYTYTVRCITSDGKSFTSDYNKTGKSVTLKKLATPQITSVKANGTSVTVTWGKVAGAEKYRLFYKKDGKWTKLKDTTGTSATITGGKLGKTYTYTVRCITSDGKSFTSDYNKTGKSVTIKNLTTPQITSVKANGTSVTVTWGKVSGAEKYRLFYKKNGKWTKLKDTTGTSATITGGTPGKTYTYTVRCINSAGTKYTSGYNKTGKSVTLKKLATPQITSVKANGTSVTVTWGKVSGAAKYRLFYKKDGKWKALKDTTGTSATITGGTLGKTYTYTVRCITSDGKSFTSDYNKTGKSVKIPKLATPQITSVKADGGTVTVTWGKVSGAAKYRLFYKKDGKWKALKDTTGTSATITGGSFGKTYTYTVRCITSDGTMFTSDYDPVGKSVTITQLNRPTITSLTNVQDGIKITWGKVSGANKYRLYMQFSGSPWVRVADTTSTSYTWKTQYVYRADITDPAYTPPGTPYRPVPTSGVTYKFTVVCIADDGRSYQSSYNPNGWSVVHWAAPTVTYPRNDADGIFVKWNDLHAPRYRVFVKVDNGGWTAIGDTSDTSFKYTKVTAGKKYTFTVRCIDTKGNYISGYDPTGKSVVYQKPSSSGGGGGGGSTTPSNPGGGTVRCRVCNNGRVTCKKCGGDGWITDKFGTKRCNNVGCVGGSIMCSTCGGDGWVR